MVTVSTKYQQLQSYFPKPVMFNLWELCFAVMTVLVRCVGIQTPQFHSPVRDKQKHISSHNFHSDTINVKLKYTVINRLVGKGLTVLLTQFRSYRTFKEKTIL